MSFAPYRFLLLLTGELIDLVDLVFLVVRLLPLVLVDWSEGVKARFPIVMDVRLTSGRAARHKEALEPLYELK